MFELYQMRQIAPTIQDIKSQEQKAAISVDSVRPL